MIQMTPSIRQNPGNRRPVTDDIEKRRLFAAPLAGGEMQEGESYSLSQKERTELLDILAHQDDALFDAFCEELEIAIGCFTLRQDFPKTQSTRGDNRKALARLSQAADKLIGQLDELPPGALRELDLALQALSHQDGKWADPNPLPVFKGTPGFTFSVMHPASLQTTAFLEGLTAHLDRIVAAIQFSQAHTPTDSGGRPINTAEILLAQTIARAFTDILDEKPATTMEGRYEQVLRFALSAGGLEDTEDRELHRLVQKALQGTKPT